MQSLNEVNADIDNELKSTAPRSITPTGLRIVLKKVTQYVTDLTLNKLSAWRVIGNGQPSLNATDYIYRLGRTIIGRDNEDFSGAALQAPSASFELINGNTGDSFRMPRYQTAPGDGLGNVRYYPFAEIPASSVSTLDFADFELTIKTWDNTSGKPTHIRLYVANRGGFFYEFSGTFLNNPGAAVEAYSQTDGRVVLFLRLDNAFRMATIRMPSSYQVTLYTPIPGGFNAPVGVSQLLDTSNVGLYIPLHRQDSNGLLTLPGGLATAALFTTGNLPTVGGAAAGVSPSIKAGSVDMCGTIAVSTSGNSASNATLLTVTFTKPLPKTPRIHLSANSASAASALSVVYPTNISPTGFSLACGNPLGGPTNYEFNYLVIG